jgi:NAD(P)-dependent dehydrogenase (short-subunit alcohol dehydrogenase family)
MKQRVVVTGCSSGFGRAIVETVASAGHTVFATMREPGARNSQAASEIRERAESAGQTVYVIDMDVTSDASVKAAANEVYRNTRHVDVVVNNAGLLSLGMAEAHTAADFQRVFDVNVYGMVRVNNAFLPEMRGREAGLLIAISSIQGRVVVPFSAAYTASKFAVEGLAEVLRYELLPLGIDSIIIEPGAFPTAIAAKSMKPTHGHITEAYGPSLENFKQLGSRFQELMPEDNMPHSTEVADAVLSAMTMRKGERPLRHVVGTVLTAEAESLNHAVVPHQREFLKTLGLEDLG